MNEYNDRWTKDKFIEFRRLKKSGLSDSMLIEHFGEDIYYSGMYSEKSSIMPWLEFLKEITITPEQTEYNISKVKSDIYLDQFDYVISFEDNGVNYIISLFYYIIEDIKTYNILLTTEKQWSNYKSRLDEIRYKGFITDEERNELIEIVEKETGLNLVYSIMRKASYILLNIDLDNYTFSIGETKNLTKINLYRNIIKNSFTNVKELGIKYDNIGNKYYLYKI